VVELEVLGPLVLRVDGEEVPLGPSLSVLLIALLCGRGQWVSVTRLADVLTEPGRPRVSADTVRSHVSHLRTALGDNPRPGEGPKIVVTGRANGSLAYALRLEAVELDVAIFEGSADEGLAELREGRYDAASAALQRALAAWRGDPFSQLVGASFAREWINNLAERHRGVAIALAAAEVGCLRHQSVLSELRRLVRDWPDELDAWILLVISLYRVGRRGEAAAVCKGAIDEVERPGLVAPPLQALQRDVLNGTLPTAGLPHLPWGVPASPLP
jgi:DNA-binding SARP family transcriptional activator